MRCLELENRLSDVRRRLRLQLLSHWLTGNFPYALGLFAAAAAAKVATRSTRTGLVVAVDMFVVLLFAGLAVHQWMRSRERLSLRRTAEWVDLHFAGHDRVATALELDNEPGLSMFADVAVSEALTQLRHVDRQFIHDKRDEARAFKPVPVLFAAGSVCVLLYTGIVPMKLQSRAGTPGGDGSLRDVAFQRTGSSVSQASGRIVRATAQNDGQQSFAQTSHLLSEASLLSARSPSQTTDWASAAAEQLASTTNVSEQDSPSSPTGAANTEGAQSSAQSTSNSTPATTATATPPPQDAAKSSPADSPPKQDPSSGSNGSPPPSSNDGSKSAQPAQPQKAPPKSDESPKNFSGHRPGDSTDKPNNRGQNGGSDLPKKSRGVTPTLLETRLPDQFEARQLAGPQQRQLQAAAAHAEPQTAAADHRAAPRQGDEPAVPQFQIPADLHVQVSDYFRLLETDAELDHAGHSLSTD